MIPEYLSFDHKDGDQILTRRQARRFALQVLFSIEFLHENVDVVTARIAKTLQSDVDDFSVELIQKTYDSREEMDQIIVDALTDRNIERVSLLERIVIRMAVCELLDFGDIPVEVTLNEAVELSKEFVSLKSSRFVNGVLDTLVRKLEDQHKIHKKLLAKLPAPGPRRGKPTKDVNL